MTPCPQCGEPLAPIDDDATTFRCKWCGWTSVLAPRGDRRRPAIEIDDVDYWPAREGGAHAV
jgi:hypothetical protein